MDWEWPGDYLVANNITHANMEVVFTLTDMPFKGGVIVEDTKKLVLPEVPGFGFIGFENEQ